MEAAVEMYERGFRVAAFEKTLEDVFDVGA
jgi:hypothetical protein